MTSITSIEAEQVEARVPKKRKLDSRHSKSHLEPSHDANRANGDNDEQRTAPEEEGRACISCRRRKTRCSRQQPCAQCSKLDVECMYDDSRERPGPKPGAIEALTQKVAALEQMLLGQGLLLEPLIKQVAAGLNHSRVMSNDQAVTSSTSAPGRSTLSEEASRLKDIYKKAATGDLVDWMANTEPNAGTCTSPFTDGPRTKHQSAMGALPSDTYLEQIVDIYFDQIHPWLPILHEQTFRARLNDNSQRSNLNIILQAMTSLCIRHVKDSSASASERRDMTMQYRQQVIIHGMDTFSVENLQALIIVTFDIIGSGKGPSSWSVVGSMSRTVEHLQLSVEDDDDPDLVTQKGSGKRTAPMITRMRFLAPPASWLQSEERRRVFWNVFIMDRFCSVATGWNNSLTSVDVRRRLPCEGALWKLGRPVSTPRFGLADTADPSSEPAGHHGLSPISERLPADGGEIEAIGGFAFAIEATENLNLVTNFFLRHSIDMEDPRQLQEWLLKFKELDLRLIKWRLSLPTKWRTACVLNQDGIMDPNLTLAHMVHNTAVIQLHQAVAYTGLQGRGDGNIIRLPAMSSAETCTAAAQEISLMAGKFLGQSTGLASPLFSFCLFIAGRSLLAHTAYYRAECDFAATSIETIITLLKEISRRWSGPLDNCQSMICGSDEKNLASRFRERLERIQTERPLGAASKHLDIRQPAYSEAPGTDVTGEPDEVTIEQCFSADHADGTDSLGHQGLMGGIVPAETTPDALSLACPPVPAAFEPCNMYNAEHFLYFGQSLGQDADYLSPQPDINTSSGPEASEVAFDFSEFLGDDDQQSIRISRFSGHHHA